MDDKENDIAQKSMNERPHSYSSGPGFIGHHVLAGGMCERCGASYHYEEGGWRDAPTCPNNSDGEPSHEMTIVIYPKPLCRKGLESLWSSRTWHDRWIDWLVHKLHLCDWTCRYCADVKEGSG